MALPSAPAVPPARSADPNKAFVPPPGWSPPGQSAAPVPAPSQALALQPASVAASTRTADPDKAFVPPPGWTPQPATQVAAAVAPTGVPTQIAVIQFGPMSVELNGKDKAVLTRVAQVQRSNGGKVRIVAHSAEDAAGSSPEALARDNFEVSRQRAIAVANQLMRLGVPANRIAAEAASDEEPAYETNTARGIAANRRAEIFVEF
jgi:outer membrane protein OmpA-like peptidoglycan-associated protein